MGVLVSFDAQGNWGDTHICDSEIAPRLAVLGVAWRPRAQAVGAAQDRPPDEALEKTRLVYLPAEDGFAGVLCEPGEWIDRLAGGPGTDLQRADAWPDLPSIDAFIETMIELSGHASAEGE